MPPRKSSDSLKNLCLNAIASNMDYWCEDYIENFAGPKTLYIISPFDCLPQELLMNLLTVLREKKLLKRPHLELILNSKFDCLNLANSIHIQISYVINLIGRRCKNLRVLDISHCVNVPRAAFMELPLVIPNIVVLKLQATECFDAVLKRIGGYCCDLKELDVSWCQQISDFGILSLCVNMDDVETGIPRCQKLEILSMSGTKTTTAAVVCALKNLPYLKKLVCYDSFKALETIYNSDFKSEHHQIPKKYLLQTLNIECENKNEKINEEQVKFAIELCPNVTVIEIANSNISNYCFVLLSHFKNLQHLAITNAMDNSISFEEGLYPLLHVTGHNLLTLTLAEIPDIDLNIIGFACPNLKCLKLFYATSYKMSSLDVGKHKAFEKLQNLQIVCIENITIPHSHLQLLLQNCLQIEYIFLQYCDSLDDEILINALKSNPFNQLLHLELEYCNSITATSILALLNASNPLQTLKMTWCKQITRIDFDYFKELVQRENFDLVIEWE